MTQPRFVPIGSFNIQSPVYIKLSRSRNETDGYQPPWIDQTTSLAGGGVMSRRRVPESWSPGEATNLDLESRLSLIASHEHQEFRHRYEKVPSMCQYQYALLSCESDDVRMLRLLPGHGEDPIRTKLEPYSLGNPPSYEAISYAWGSKSDNAFILVCDGDEIYSVVVPRSLHGALKRLRHGSESRVIWADAVCINQEDDKEKSHQIQLMRRIYQKATRVVIWLGEDHEWGCSASSLFDLTSQLYHRNFEAVPPLEDRHTWMAIQKLFNSPWFWRVWCLQEAVLAPSAQVMLGEHSTPWEHIGSAATWLRCSPFWAPHFHNTTLVGIYNACLIYALSHVNERQQRVSFLQLLTLTRPFIARDFRDKVYGILGIPTTDSDPDVGEFFLQPDYTKTLSEVYIDCALAIITSTRSLRMLSYVQHERLPREATSSRLRTHRDETLFQVPSWVPRWHRYSARTLAPPEQEENTFRASASLRSKSVANTDVRGLTLITHGAQISCVKQVSGPFDDSRAEDLTPTDMANEVYRVVKGCLEASTANTTELLHALSIVLTAGKNWFGTIVEDVEQHVADFFDLLYQSWLLSDDTGVETTPWRPNMLQDFLFRPRTDLALPQVDKVGQASRFREAMRHACGWRRVVVMEDGHVGLGPLVTEPGDIVCILMDAIVPLLVRPEANGESFKLVGEAYIHGMMFGEVTIPEVEQVVLSDRPFLDTGKTGPGDS